MNNKAPRDATFSAFDKSHLYVDARYNYWESNGKKGVPDDSLFNLGDKIKFKPLIKSFINWTSVVVPNNWYTGPQIGGHGEGTGSGPLGPGGGIPGPGSNLGPGGGGQYGPVGGSDYGNGTSQGGKPISNPGINGSSNANSLSQIDESNANKNLLTVGLTANVASLASVGGFASSDAGKSSSSSSSEDVKAYELDEEEVTKQLDNPKTIFTFIGLIIILIICLFIGYKRRKDKENE